MAQFVTVTLKDRTRVTEEVMNPDRVRWDLTASKQKWPKFTDAPFLGMTFFAFAAFKRTGRFDGTWEQWRDEECLDVEITDADGNPVDEEDLAGE